MINIIDVLEKLNTVHDIWYVAIGLVNVDLIFIMKVQLNFYLHEENSSTYSCF
jgi:hypothetical protein